MEWVSVEDKLPELKDDSVLAYFEHGGMDMVHIEDYFRPDGSGNYWYKLQKVTHWMPMPDAPTT